MIVNWVEIQIQSLYLEVQRVKLVTRLLQQFSNATIPKYSKQIILSLLIGRSWVC